MRIEKSSRRMTMRYWLEYLAFNWFRGGLDPEFENESLFFPFSSLITVQL